MTLTSLRDMLSTAKHDAKRWQDWSNRTMREYGQGSIKKRGENRWLIRWRVKDALSGKSAQHCRVIKGDYAAAEVALRNELNPPAEQGQKQPEPKMTLGAFLDGELWQDYIKRWRQNSTAITNESMLKCHIRPFFGETLLQQIGPEQIGAFQRKLIADHKSEKMRRNIHTMLVCVLTRAKNAGYIAKLPTENKDAIKDWIPKARKNSNKPVLTAQQAQSLIENTPIKYRAFVTLSLFTSARVGEALGLQWRHVNWAENKLTIEQAWYRGKIQPVKTDESAGTICVPARVIEALRNHKAMAHYVTPNDYVFASNSGKPWNPDMVRSMLHDALKAIGITPKRHKHGAHLLRHTAGALMYESTGGNVLATQSFMRHASERTTLGIYGHLSEEAKQRAMQSLENALFAPVAQPEKGAVN